jgi:hypothetical protein
MKPQVLKQKVVFDLMIVLGTFIENKCNLLPLLFVIEYLSNSSKKKLFILLALSVGLCTTQKLLTFVVFAMKVLV